MRTRRCANCACDRPKRDMFWHKNDRKWYCQDVFTCELRLAINRKRDPEAVYSRDIEASGVSL